MALAPGTRDEPAAPGGALAACGRMAGFVLLAGLGLAIIAGVVLVPAYARLRTVRYERECLAARNRDAEALIAAYERLIAEAPKDPVLTERLARSQLGLWPRNEVVVEDAGLAPAPPPGMIQPVRHPRPAPPPDWLVHVDARLRNPPTRRGLFLIAIGLLGAAMFLFAPPRLYRKSDANE